MTTRILLVPIKVSVGLVKLELRIVRGVARLAFELGRESARGDRTATRAAAEAAPEPRLAGGGRGRAAAPRAARATRGARGRAEPRRRAVPRRRASPPPAGPPSTRRPRTPRRPAAAPEPALRRPSPRAARARGARPTEPAAPPAGGPRRSSDPTPGEIAAAREALREAEIEDPTATVGPAAHAGPEIHLDPPWEGYDAMALDEVLGRLQAADPTTLAACACTRARTSRAQAILLATETP